MKKEECLKQFREDETLKTVLSQTKDEDERRRIKAYAENFLSKFYDNIYVPFEKLSREDPEVLKASIQEVLEHFNNKGQEGK